jgi:DNA ligase-1
MKNNSRVCLDVLGQELIKNDDHFSEHTGRANEYGWEGLILRADTPYKGKRSKDLLKYKSFFDDEYVVLDVENGPFRYVKNGKEVEEKMLSCVVIEHKGHKVRVGSGFTIDQRQEFFKHPNRLINKQITVQYFSESENQQGGLSLRFPTFKYLHGEKREL